MTDCGSAVMSLEAACLWRERLRAEGRRLVITNGCFDLLHRGHVTYLAAARAAGDALLVLVNSDASVRALKGPSRPLNDQESRAVVLCALKSVDAAVIFDGARCDRELARLAPDVYVKGGDYTEETLDPEELAALRSAGSEIVFIRFVDGFSTTGIIRKMSVEKFDK